MFFLYTFILTVYAVCLFYILLFSLSQLRLLIIYLTKKHETQNAEISNYPFVTVQLPVYNEKYVIEGLLDCIEKINYPTNKLQVQLLDDSTDESIESTAKKICEMQERNFPIEHITRKNRTGYKAGALLEGLKTAKGEFIAIFDADFLPDKNFIKRILSAFTEEKIGLVQVPWKHLNENYSLLTRMQAFGLNAHFIIEQTARNTENCFINFNGTAGIWRKKCILDAGNWHTDTLTEDLDLSYRAQLKGWKFAYLPSDGCLSELPITISALKTQQFRWTKGAAQCAKKNLKHVLCNKNISFQTKWIASFHLLNSSIFPAILLIAILTFPIFSIKQTTTIFDFLFRISSFFIVSVVIIFLFYGVSFFKHKRFSFSTLLSFLFHFISFLSVSMALSIHNSIAVVEGFTGIKSEFVRTPKFNVQSIQNDLKRTIYSTNRISLLNIIEFLTAVYFLYSAWFCFTIEAYGAIPFMLMFCFGLLYIFISSIFSSLKYNL